MNADLLQRVWEGKLRSECAQFAAGRAAWNARIASSKLLLGILSAGLMLLVIGGCTFISSPLSAVGGIVGLGVVCLVWLRPWLALLFVILGAGLPSLLLPVPGHTVRPVESALLLCLFVIITRRPCIQIKLPHVLALLFFTVALISFMHVPEISTSVNALGANKRLYNLVIILLALFCGTCLVEFIPDLSSLCVLLVLSNIPLYLIALAQFLGIHVPPQLAPNQDPATTGDAGRLVGPFDGAAAFGIYLTGLFALSSCCWLLGTHKRDRVIGLLMTLASALAIVGSGTRSALVAMGAILCIALIVTRRFKIFSAVVLLALGGFAAFPATILAHFTHAQTSTSNRLFLWNEALKLIAANPIIGIGLEQFHYYYDRLIISQATQLNQHGISIHNQYLEWGVEGGMPWLILGVLFLLSLIVVCARNYRYATPDKRLPLLATALAACATLLTGLLDVPMDDVEVGVFLCLLAGIALGSTMRTARLTRAGTSQLSRTGVPQRRAI